MLYEAALIVALFALGAFIEWSKAAAKRGTKHTATQLIGKAGIGAATSLVAGVIMLYFTKAGWLPVLGAGAALALVGPTAVRSAINKVLK